MAEMTREERMTLVGRKLLTEFEANEVLRREKETEWLESLRQAKGVYDPEVLSKIPMHASKVYPKYTRSKEIPCVAKLNSMLFPDNDKNWEIEPTPDPEVDEMVVQQLIQAIMETSEPHPETGQQMMPTEAQIREAVMQYARAKCKNMSVVMEDQLVEMDYKEHSKDVIKSGVRYGTGVLKGPLSIKREVPVYRAGEEGKIIKEVEIEFDPFIDFVQLWYWYPDMTTTEHENVDFDYELHPMSKHDLRELADRPDFDGKKIREYIKKYKDGNYKQRYWEIQLQSLQAHTDKLRTNRYQVLERWGYIDGYFLRDAGVEVRDDQLDVEYFSNIWLLGDEIIKAVVSPLPEGAEVYHVFYFSKDETSIFGDGLPKAIRDTAIAIGAASRMMLNNAARVARPILEVNTDLMEEGQPIDDLQVIFQRTGRGAEAAYQAIRVVQFDSHIDEYATIIDLFKKFGDEESTLPSFLWGDQTALTNETARGMSVRAANTQVTLADLVKSFDRANESFLKSLYAWNRTFNPREDIKGDFVIKASGSSSLMAKELRTQALDYFTTTFTPGDEPYIKRGDFLRIRARIHDLEPKDFIRTDAEAEQWMQMQKDMEADALIKAQADAEVRYTHSKAAHMEAKARKTDAETGPDEEKREAEIDEKIALSEKHRADAGKKKIEGAAKLHEALNPKEKEESKPGTKK